jgi:glutamate synthase domain-containing protein 2
MLIFQFALICEKGMGRGAKPDIDSHFPGEKIVEVISKTRMIPRGTDALSPAL